MLFVTFNKKRRRGAKTTSLTVVNRIELKRVTKAFFRMAAANTDYISEIVQDSFNPSNDSDQIVFNKDFYKAKKEVIIFFSSIIIFHLLLIDSF